MVICLSFVVGSTVMPKLLPVACGTHASRSKYLSKYSAPRPRYRGRQLLLPEGLVRADYRRTTVIEHEGPGVCARRPSAVTSWQPSASASATYVASYAVRSPR